MTNFWGDWISITLFQQIFTFLEFGEIYLKHLLRMRG